LFQDRPTTFHTRLTDGDDNVLFCFFFSKKKKKKKTHFPFFLKTLHDFDELFMFCFGFFSLLLYKEEEEERG
jgi:hypothetical protein